jgi:hypothetical protein
MDGRAILFKLKLQATLEARDDLYYHPSALRGVSAKISDPCFYHPLALQQLSSRLGKVACLNRLSLFAQSTCSLTTNTVTLEQPRVR